MHPEPNTSEDHPTTPYVGWCVGVGLYALTPFVVPHKYLACLLWLFALGWLVTAGRARAVRIAVGVMVIFVSSIVLTFTAGDLKSLGQWDGGGGSRSLRGHSVAVDPPAWQRHVDLAQMILLMGGPGLLVAWLIGRRREGVSVTL